MSADGEIEVAVKAEGVDDAAAEMGDAGGGAEGEGGGLASTARGGGGGLTGSLKKGGLIAGIAALIEPLLKVLEPIKALLSAFLAPLAVLSLRLLQPVLRQLIKLLPAWFNLINSIGSFIPTWEEGMQNLRDLVGFVRDLPSRIWQAASSFFAWLANGAASIGSAVWNAIKAGASWIANGAKNIGSQVWTSIKSWATGLASDIASLPGDIWSKMKQLPGQIATALKNKLPSFASGGIVNEPTLATVGEAGSEAIVPLDRLESMMQGQRREDPTPVVIQGGLSTLVEQIERDPDVEL